jgi:hypothetical protein
LIIPGVLVEIVKIIPLGTEAGISLTHQQIPRLLVEALLHQGYDAFLRFESVFLYLFFEGPNTWK